MKKFYALFSTTAITIFVLGSAIAQNPNHKVKNYFHYPENVKESDCHPKTVILKVKKQYASICSLTALNNYLLEIGANNIHKKFPHAQKPEREYNAQGLKYADLTRIYQFNYSADISLETVINTVYSLNIAEYAEPDYIMTLFYTPNDPQLSQQYHINKIKAPQAWGINKGDTNIVIGIVDSGTDWDHPDLQSNIKYNYADPINGIDDDGDTYIDNFRGWDVSDIDNDPMVSGQVHGSHVSGCAAAATDNGVGVAGTGFKCKFLPVKSAKSTSTTSIDNGYEGIAYAAEHGCKIINCSWGGAGGGQSSQNVIDYATINFDALVVAAAGNNNNEALSFPGAFNHVISVAASTSTDTRASFSTYGTWVSVTAPGDQIYATVYNDTYQTMSGTSMASPVTAGAAAIIRSTYPFMNALQAGEQLKVTCDPMPNEPQYALGKMGHGRIDMYTAVNGLTSPSVVMTQKSLSDSGDEAFVTGDTIYISGTFTNYLLPTGNLTATLTTTTPSYITIIDGSSTLGVISTMKDTNNTNDPYKVVIKAGTPINAKADFTITISDGTYTTKAYLSFTVNVDYINIAINAVATSVTSKSLIGFNDFSTQLEGLGFRYYSIDTTNMLFDGGLLVGIPSLVSDNVRSSPSATNDADFASVMNVARVTPPVVSEFDVTGIFSDATCPAPIPVEVHHKAYAWSKVGHRKYVMFEYTIKNTGGNVLDSLFAGIFTDWDIYGDDASAGYNNNKASTDMQRKLGYAYNTHAGGYYVGTQVLTSNANFYHYAMDNNAGTAGVHCNVSYTTSDKYTTLSTMRTDAGVPPDPGYGGKDISDVVSTGPFKMGPGDSVTIAFAMMAGDNLADIQKTADSACAQYPGCVMAPNRINELAASGPHFTVYPNPASEITTMYFTLTSSEKNAVIGIYNLLGAEIYKTKISNLQSQITIDVSNFESGIYFCRLKTSDGTFTKKMTVVK